MFQIDITLLDERFCRISARLISITVLELLLGIGLDVARDNTTPRWLFWRGLLSAVLSSPQRLTSLSQLHLSELVERERIIYIIGVVCTTNIISGDCFQVRRQGDRFTSCYNIAARVRFGNAAGQFQCGIQKIQSQQIRSDIKTFPAAGYQDTCHRNYFRSVELIFIGKTDLYLFLITILIILFNHFDYISNLIVYLFTLFYSCYYLLYVVLAYWRRINFRLYIVLDSDDFVSWFRFIFVTFWYKEKKCRLLLKRIKSIICYAILLYR